MVKRNLLLIMLTLALVACGGDDFEPDYYGTTTVPDAGGSDAESDTGKDVVTFDVDTDAPVEAGPDSLLPPDAAPDTVVDATSEEASVVPDADVPDTAPEAAPDGPQPEACVPTTCQAQNAQCGSVPDGCGGTLSCGSCTPPETCGGSGTPNVCGQAACVPKTCAELGKNCGWVDDGCGTQISCGSCPTNQTCGGGGTPNVCGGCVPITCASVPQYCGLLEDGCGNTIDCGPYNRGYDPSCDGHPGYPHKWYCSPEQTWAPPPFETGCVPDYWPGSYCCKQGD